MFRETLVNGFNTVHFFSVKARDVNDGGKSSRYLLDLFIDPNATRQ